MIVKSVMLFITAGLCGIGGGYIDALTCRIEKSSRVVVAQLPPSYFADRLEEGK